MCDLIQEYSHWYRSQQQIDQQRQTQQEKALKRAHKFQQCINEVQKHLTDYRLIRTYTQPTTPFNLHGQSEQSPNQFELGGYNLKFSNQFSVFARVTVRQEMQWIRTEMIPMSNGIPFCVKTKKKRLLLVKSFHGLNSLRKEGVFKIDPRNGHMSYILQSAILPSHFNSLIFNPQLLVQIIQSELQSAEQQFFFNFYKILYLADVYSHEDLNYFSSIGRKFRKVKYDTASIDTLKTFVDFSTCPFNFTKSLDWADRQAPFFQGLEDLQAELSKQTECDSSKLQNYFKNYGIDCSNLKHHNRNQKEFIEGFLTNKLDELKRILKLQHYKMSNSLQNNFVYSQIKLKNDEGKRWEYMGEGGFTNIEKAEVEYSNAKSTRGKDGKKMEESLIKKVLVRKVEKPQKQKKGKIGHQKSILSLLQNLSCLNICKYYYSTQPAYQNMLFMENYAYRSLDIFLENHETTMSQITLIFLMYQAAQALRFLKIQKIYHYDVKPANMLIGKMLLLRISDFGQSYNERVCTPEFKPGFTKRYSPPEVYSKRVNFSPSSDVFSLGLVMLQTITDKYPVDIKELNGDGCRKLVNFFKGNSDAKLLVVPERTAQQGCQTLLLVLQMLFLKNISSELRERPLVDWNVLALIKSFVYLDSQY